jgi:hypothetical protein
LGRIVDIVKVSGASVDSEDIGDVSENDETKFGGDGDGAPDAPCFCEKDGPSLGRAVLGERE